MNKHNKRKQLKKRTKVFLGIATSLVLIIIVVLVGITLFLRQTNSAVDVDAYLISSANVKVLEMDDYILFDSKSTDKAIVMYGGANIDKKAYAPICRKLAELEYDVYLLKVYENFALLDIDKASTVLDYLKYSNITLIGHSLGGVAAAYYLKKSTQKIDNIIFLASYSNVDISDMDVNVISIHCTLDGVENKDNVNKSREYMPESFHEIWIEGGNHAQFGSYGKQKGDNDATITMEEQLNQSIDFIIKYIK